ncbi:MAG TPA: hypothetical protein VHX86_03265 [Tepidisphaeraceae bacterium]|nr:hypothetical protein [Tepidisphaeraceae bacterium]
MMGCVEFILIPIISRAAANSVSSFLSVAILGFDRAGSLEYNTPSAIVNAGWPDPVHYRFEVGPEGARRRRLLQWSFEQILDLGSTEPLAHRPNLGRMVRANRAAHPAVRLWPSHVEPLQLWEEALPAHALEFCSPNKAARQPSFIRIKGRR